MMRTKVVNDSTDLVPLLRAFDNKTKKEVFNELLLDWKPTSAILERYGEEGADALEYFDKMKLVETKWTTPDEGIEGKPQKKYRSYYSAFNINISCPVNEIYSLASVLAPINCGITMAARIPRITTTIKISTSVKPFSALIFPPFNNFLVFLDF